MLNRQHLDKKDSFPKLENVGDHALQRQIIHKRTTPRRYLQINDLQGAVFSCPNFQKNYLVTLIIGHRTSH